MGHARFDVLPTSVQLYPISLYPASVVFREWQGEPPLKLSLKQREKMRPFEKEIHGLRIVHEKLKEYYKRLKSEAKLKSVPPVLYEENDPMIKFYEPVKRYGEPEEYWEDAMLRMVLQTKSVLVLDPEELQKHDTWDSVLEEDKDEVDEDESPDDVDYYKDFEPPKEEK